ncbi:GvpL/GvpF family gas vesicle protein [Amycolatopsis sp.]|uniref:GvpL/GvpF family gas vesicle protein n=1 Tax=Amycolatopsis sp. TaxID=37632 RepID=UPI002C9CE9E9|nr:GvpL/GvpF family gas vesicle protein [Amycolatopsis sp.]HVV12796.1 GvpL/GvpF family gas vesicle protein [Amycolatopsis sp.]
MATETETAVYVYGIVPADVETEPGARGVGDPPAPVTIVRCDGIAALVSEIPGTATLGRPDDLAAHAALLDAAAAEAPVLPLRFGAVVTDERQVEEELLKAHQDDFRAALEELEGKAEYVIKARYEERAVLREILSENPELAESREQIRGKPEDATRNERIALGERIEQAIAAKREADTQRVVDALAALDVRVVVREPTHEEDAAYVACLADTAKQRDLEAVVGKLARDWEGRVNTRLLGPIAAYDFVVTREPEA